MSAYSPVAPRGGAVRRAGFLPPSRPRRAARWPQHIVFDWNCSTASCDFCHFLLDTVRSPMDSKGKVFEGASA